MSQMILACMGDSLTEGYDIIPSKRWTDILASNLGIKVINSGISGDTTTGMLSRFGSMVIDQAPTHCIIMGGTNDVAHGIPTELIVSNIRAMTRRARYHGIQSIIGLPSPILVDEQHLGSMYAPMLEFADQMDAFTGRLRQFAEEDGQPLIDFGQGMVKEHFIPDGVHPNEEGHAQMAQNAGSVIREMLT